MRVFLTSDTHFGHSNVIKYCNRPFQDRDEMDKAIIKNWNETVTSEDKVFHLGDFSFRNKQETNYLILKTAFSEQTTQEINY